MLGSRRSQQEVTRLCIMDEKWVVDAIMHALGKSV